MALNFFWGSASPCTTPTEDNTHSVEKLNVICPSSVSFMGRLTTCPTYYGKERAGHSLCGFFLLTNSARLNLPGNNVPFGIALKVTEPHHCVKVKRGTSMSSALDPWFCGVGSSPPVAILLCLWSIHFTLKSSLTIMVDEWVPKWCGDTLQWTSQPVA